MILPGRDPTESGPPAEDQDQESYPVTADSLDNIEEGMKETKVHGGNVHRLPNSCNN